MGCHRNYTTRRGKHSAKTSSSKSTWCLNEEGQQFHWVTSIVRNKVFSIYSPKYGSIWFRVDTICLPVLIINTYTTSKIERIRRCFTKMYWMTEEWKIGNTFDQHQMMYWYDMKSVMNPTLHTMKSERSCAALKSCSLYHPRTKLNHEYNKNTKHTL
jgi:hypothetical protein